MVVTFLLVSTRDLTLRIELYGAVVSDRDYTDGAERTVHEIATDVPVAGNARYTMTFTVLRGDVEFSDVVLWFQT